MACDECKSEIVELREDLQEIEGPLGEQLVDLKRANKKAWGYHTQLICWLLVVVRSLLPMNLIVDRRGNAMRPRLLADLEEIGLPKCKE